MAQDEMRKLIESMFDRWGPGIKNHISADGIRITGVEGGPAYATVRIILDDPALTDLENVYRIAAKEKARRKSGKPDSEPPAPAGPEDANNDGGQ